jgi:hypothetical protein
MLWNDKQYNESMISLPFCQFVNVGVPISLFLKEQIKGIQFFIFLRFKLFLGVDCVPMWCKIKYFGAIGILDLDKKNSTLNMDKI